MGDTPRDDDEWRDEGAFWLRVAPADRVLWVPWAGAALVYALVAIWVTWSFRTRVWPWVVGFCALTVPTLGLLAALTSRLFATRAAIWAWFCLGGCLGALWLFMAGVGLLALLALIR